MSVFLDCVCHGLGCVIRERQNGLLCEWPCPLDCQPPFVFIAVNNRKPRKARIQKKRKGKSA